MFFVAQRRFIGVSFACFKTGRRRIVLHDIVVPVEDPHVSIRTYFGMMGAAHFIAGHQIEGIGARIIGPVALQLRRLPRDALSVRRRTRPDSTTQQGSCERYTVRDLHPRITTVPIDLANLVSRGCEHIRIGNHFSAWWVTTFNPFVIPIGIGMKLLGLPFAVEPKISPSSLIPIPQVLLLVARMNSS